MNTFSLTSGISQSSGSPLAVTCETMSVPKEKMWQGQGRQKWDFLGYLKIQSMRGERNFKLRAERGSRDQCSSVQACNRGQLFATPWTAAHQASLSITNSRSLLKLMSIGDAIQPSHPLSSPSPPAFCLSQLQGLFQ